MLVFHSVTTWRVKSKKDLRLDTGMLWINFCIQGKRKNPPVTLIRIELHSLGLEVSISPLVALISVEWHSLGLATVYINKVSA